MVKWILFPMFNTVSSLILSLTKGVPDSSNLNLVILYWIILLLKHIFPWENEAFSKSY